MASGFIYWCDFSSTVAAHNGVRRIKPDGSGLRSIVTSGIGRNGIRGIAVDWAAGMHLCLSSNFFKVLLIYSKYCVFSVIGLSGDPPLNIVTMGISPYGEKSSQYLLKKNKPTIFRMHNII